MWISFLTVTMVRTPYWTSKLVLFVTCLIIHLSGIFKWLCFKKIYTCKHLTKNIQNIRQMSTALVVNAYVSCVSMYCFILFCYFIQNIHNHHVWICLEYILFKCCEPLLGYFLNKTDQSELWLIQFHGFMNQFNSVDE